MVRRLPIILPIHRGMGGVWLQFMGEGGAKQRMIKYRLCRRFDWVKKPGYSIIETFPCMVGLISPP